MACLALISQIVLKKTHNKCDTAITVGKQTPCELSFAQITVKSERILTVRTKPKFGFVVPFALVICKAF